MGEPTKVFRSKNNLSQIKSNQLNPQGQTGANDSRGFGVPRLTLDHPPGIVHPTIWYDPADTSTMEPSPVINNTQITAWRNKGTNPISLTPWAATPNFTYTDNLGVPMVYFGGNPLPAIQSASGSIQSHLWTVRGKYSLYIVLRGLSMIPATGNLWVLWIGGNTGFHIYFRFNSSYNNCEIVPRAMVSSTVVWEAPYEFDRGLGVAATSLNREYKDCIILSIRCENKGVGQHCGTVSVNGVPYYEIVPNNPFRVGALTTNTILRLGTTSAGSGDWAGNMGDLLIYEGTMHDIDTHNCIVQWLMEKYRV